MEYPSLIVLGSTGSVGTQTLDVARKKNINVKCLCANRDYKLIESQAREFLPDAVAISDEAAARKLKIGLADTDIKVFSGADGIIDMIYGSDAEAAVNSILGMDGLMPSLATLRSGKKLALANKESLVIAGDIVMKEASAHSAEILPVDSEHCAIHQCLRSGDHAEVSRLILTASGGPFYGYTEDMLKGITVEMALAHPTWKMGKKITVDSATLMNKGFEVIEAAHLFGVPEDKIDVIIHRESIVHSMVEFVDKSVIAQLSLPDMRHCVQYALTYPFRDSDAGMDEGLDLGLIGKLTFSRPDEDTFILLGLAKQALKAGGAMPCVMNAANEVAVAAFLDRKIGFCDIFETVCRVYEEMKYAKNNVTLESIIESDKEARILAEKYTASN